MNALATRFATNAALAALSTGAFATSPATSASASGPVRTLCANSAWIEQAPASRPQGVLYRHDRFRVDRRATVLHGKSKGLWLHGKHLSKDKRTGWVKASFFCH